MSIEPVASVIIPAFNSVSTIQRAVGAAQAQTSSNIEIIVVDDGSADETASAFLELAGRDNRCKLIRHDERQGPSVARNTALRSARGRWIALLDADDWMEVTRLQDLTAQAEARELDALADNLLLVEAESLAVIGKALDPELMSRTGNLALSDMLCADWPGRNTQYRGFGVAKPIIRRALIEKSGIGYDPSVRLGEDFLFYCSLAAFGARVGVTPQCGYHYTTNAQTLSRLRRPTMELVDVNERIRRFVAATWAPAPTELPQLLDDRAAALRFQVFTWSLKVADLPLAMRVAASIPLKTLAMLSGEKVLRRHATSSRTAASVIQTACRRT